jgi:2Fe-2S ferredoxin
MSYVTFFPSGEKCFAKKGKSILDIAFEHLIEIDHNCAGVAACTSCRIIVKEGSEHLNGFSEDELFMLKSENLYTTDSRLACQCKIINGDDSEIIIEIPSK